MPDFVVNPRTAPTMVAGLRDPGGTLSNRIKVDIQDEILKYMPSASPLTVLTRRVRDKRKTTQYQFDWLTKDEYPRAVTLAADATSGTTSLTVASGQGDRIAGNWLMLNVVTREVVLVSSVATDTLTVVRAIGSTNVAMTAGDTLVYLATAFEDGSGFGTMKSIKEDRDFNYTQIIRTQYGFTGRQIVTDMYGGKDPMTERQFWSIEHAKSIEQMLFFGRRHTRTGSGGKLQTMAGGLEYFITSNVWDVNATEVSERAFVEALEEGMRWGQGGNQSGMGLKYLFASSRWCTEIEFWAKNRLEYRPEDKTIGLAAMDYKSTHGTIRIMKAPVLDYNHPDYAFLVDLNHIRYAYLQGRDTMLLKDRQGNDVDGSEEEVMSDCGAQVELEASHMLFKGLST